MASKALRTIGFAYREIHGKEDLISKDEKNVYLVEKKDLVLLGIFGIKDIIRPEVPLAIQQCKTAGIKVRMVTGDNKLTAKAIARECGIVQDGDTNSIVLEGYEFIQKIGGVVCKLCKTAICDCATDKEQAEKTGKPLRIDTIKNKEAFDRIYEHLEVLARSRPEDKYALVTGLREKGVVVAVTGDGTNDAPALKKADVGFAMGITGTSVAQEASSIILMDDNFSSIVKAVIWGRNIYDAIRKFLQFQMTVNIVAVICTVVGAAILRQPVLRAIQLLWVNLIMDTFASLALATEPPTEELLNRMPYKKTEYILSNVFPVANCPILL
jgi:Ca2+ transporting ATPase